MLDDAHDDPSEDLLFDPMSELDESNRYVVLERLSDASGQTYVQTMREADDLFLAEHRAGGPTNSSARRYSTCAPHTELSPGGHSFWPTSGTLSSGSRSPCKCRSSTARADTDARQTLLYTRRARSRLGMKRRGRVTGIRPSSQSRIPELVRWLEHVISVCHRQHAARRDATARTRTGSRSTAESSRHTSDLAALPTVGRAPERIHTSCTNSQRGRARSSRVSSTPDARAPAASCREITTTTAMRHGAGADGCPSDNGHRSGKCRYIADADLPFEASRPSPHRATKWVWTATSCSSRHERYGRRCGSGPGSPSLCSSPGL